MLERLEQLDRRWIFLAMFFAVAIPLLTQARFPEQPTALTDAVFRLIEELPEQSLVLFALDSDPSSAAELQPMTAALIRHCVIKRHKLVFATTWPTGPPLVDQNIRDLLETEFAGLKLQNGVDYVNLGYKPGNEVAIKVIAENLREAFTTDARGKPLDECPILAGVENVGDFAVVLNISAGYPGAKEWVQYGRTRHAVPLAAGCTGVQAPQLYPYVPDQMRGLLAAIKGAAEYEAALTAKYPDRIDPKKNTAMTRMGPQLFAHMLVIGLILLGNVAPLSRRWLS